MASNRSDGNKRPRVSTYIARVRRDIYTARKCRTAQNRPSLLVLKGLPVVKSRDTPNIFFSRKHVMFVINIS